MEKIENDYLPNTETIIDKIAESTLAKLLQLLIDS